MTQGCEGLLSMIGADRAVGGRLTAGLVLSRDRPGDTPNLLGEDAHALGGDAAVTVVQDALLHLCRADQAVAASQVVCGEGGGASVGLGVGRVVGCDRCGVVLCQQRRLDNAV